ncbi:unnamed protein product [Allacma fusca]|uniref:Uncharacterized protein n=1 Tax=Allacma fusca TaxID=39272 RepID=A0A8J2KW66_9HEXA|nr:unnamed protein product [Allacma fusca]
MSSQPPVIRPGQFFTFNNSLITSFLAWLVSYVLILTQFNSPVKDIDEEHKRLLKSFQDIFSQSVLWNQTASLVEVPPDMNTNPEGDT